MQIQLSEMVLQDDPMTPAAEILLIAAAVDGGMVPGAAAEFVAAIAEGLRLGESDSRQVFLAALSAPFEKDVALRNLADKLLALHREFVDMGDNRREAAVMAQVQAVLDQEPASSLAKRVALRQIRSGLATKG